MKNKNYVYKTITLKCDLCSNTLRVRKSKLNSVRLNAIYNHNECLCPECFDKSPKAFDYNFIRYCYGDSKTFTIFPKTVSIAEIKNNIEMIKSAKKLSATLLSGDFGRQMQRQFLKIQMLSKNLKIIG